MSDFQDKLMDHEYDGIQEFDNRLPNWWLYTLYGAIVFAVAYWLAYHTWGWAPLSHEQYHREQVAAAEAQLAAMEGRELTNETLTLMSTVPASVEAGRAVFEQFCVVCHKPDGSGSVGPNLTDRYWLHGGQPLEIHYTVTNGVADKGMAAWGSQLGPQRVQDVVAYVLTLKGRNLPGKDPQGIEESASIRDEPAAAAGDGSAADGSPGDGSGAAAANDELPASTGSED
jgi:cytochrome c oxidase cbb3-type subunit 3